jgi:hypothetical protein
VPVGIIFIVYFTFKTQNFTSNFSHWYRSQYNNVVKQLYLPILNWIRLVFGKRHWTPTTIYCKALNIKNEWRWIIFYTNICSLFSTYSYNFAIRFQNVLQSNDQTNSQLSNSLQIWGSKVYGGKYVSVIWNEPPYYLVVKYVSST